jgi:hypothetical protein
MDYLFTSLLVRCDSLVPAFDLGSLLGNLVAKAKSYGSGFIIFLGIIMIAVAAFKIGKGLMTQGKPNAQPINWFLCAGLLIVGGTMAFGGFSAMSSIAKSFDSTIDDLTNDSMFQTTANDAGDWGMGDE